MKIVKSRLFKKYLNGKKSWHGFVCWLAKYKSKKVIEHHNSVDAQAHKVVKVISLFSNFYANFSDIWSV